jgi:type II secretory pathway pseudopilin PulG
MKKNDRFKSFTIIELIIVIAIIAVLIALMMPVVTKMSKRAKETKAKAEMQSIVTAIKSYEATYGVLPFSGAETDLSNSDYSNLMELLTDVASGGGTPTTYRNSRQIRFLDVPESYTTKGYVDPWDNNYKVFVDTDYNGQANVLGDTLYGTIFVYSTGAGSGSENYIYSWK